MFLCGVYNIHVLVQLILCMSPFQKEESMRKIRELGSLPSDAFDKYQGLTLSQVCVKCTCILARFFLNNEKRRNVCPLYS